MSQQKGTGLQTRTKTFHLMSYSKYKQQDTKTLHTMIKKKKKQLGSTVAILNDVVYRKEAEMCLRETRGEFHI